VTLTDAPSAVLLATAQTLGTTTDIEPEGLRELAAAREPTCWCTSWEADEAELSTGTVDNLSTRVDDTRGWVHKRWTSLWRDRAHLPPQAL
jgi:hypothetical protein